MFVQITGFALFEKTYTFYSDLIRGKLIYIFRRGKKIDFLAQIIIFISCKFKITKGATFGFKNKFF